jgi:uncharacterized surface protein with fasciclin (FAS1) repeats
MDNKLNIIETAEKAGKFTTFTKALTATGLDETLKGDGPFTIFAPSDEAFNKLHENSLANLMRPENMGKLKATLMYHVLPGKLMAGEMEKKSTAIETMHGQTLKVETSNGVRVNNVTVQNPDIEASNGVIHVINNVLMPSKSASAK